MDHKIGSGARCAMIGYGSWATGEFESRFPLMFL